MPDLDPIRSQIRFHLAELSARNEHHGFERLCSEVVRERICRNVVPATGPVSAGGDQGRDLETFKTYLEASPLRDSTFLGMASDGILVFACSTEKEPAGRSTPTWTRSWRGANPPNASTSCPPTTSPLASVTPSRTRSGKSTGCALRSSTR